MNRNRQWETLKRLSRNHSPFERKRDWLAIATIVITILAMYGAALAHVHFAPQVEVSSDLSQWQ